MTDLSIIAPTVGMLTLLVFLIAVTALQQRMAGTAWEAASDARAIASQWQKQAEHWEALYRQMEAINDKNMATIHKYEEMVEKERTP